MSRWFLGQYSFTGDTEQLLAAYATFMRGVPAGALILHACVVTDDGIAILDACPDRETFLAFSTSEQVLAGMEAAGLGRPTVTHLGTVHAAQVAGGVRVV